MAAEGMTPEQEMMMKALFEAFAKLRGSTDSVTQSLESMSKDTGKTAAQLDIELQKLSTDLKQKTKPEFGSFFKALASGKGSFVSMQSEIDQLTAAAKKSKVLDEQNRLLQQRDALQDSESKHRARAEAEVATAQGVRQMAGIMASGATTAVSGLIKGLQAGSSGTQLATGMMTAAVDVAAGSGKALGGVIGGVGSAMSGMGGKAKIVGLGLTVLGSAVGFASEQAGKLAKFGIEVLSKEVEKTVGAFNAMSASGAIFANGMQGMRDASAGAGLTVDQFSKVVSANSELIGASGLGVVEGAKQIGRVGKELQKSGVQTQLLKLGYSFEEQAALTAETMANMRKAGGGKLDDKEVATQTQKYAENLRLISSITGEDAKKKMAVIQQENAALAFQQKIAAMEPKQRAQLNAAMATMTDQEAKNFRDRMVFGEVINKEGAIYEATVAGAREKGEAAVRLAEQNNLTAATNSDLNVQFGDQIKASILSQQALGIAAYSGAESVKGAAAAMAQALDQANNYTAEGVANAKKNNEAAAKTTDALTNSVIDAEKAAQSMKIKLQEMMDVPISKFAQVSKQMLEAVAAQLAELGLGGKGKPGEKQGPSTWDRVKTAGAKALDYGLTGASIGGVVGGGFAGIGAVPGAVIGGIGGAVAGALTDWFSDKSGKAVGGIASGPKSGYIEKLHGEEAVIPTVGGKVPLDVRMPTLDPVALAQAQKDTITQTLNAGFGGMGTDMSANLSKSFEMVKPTAGTSGGGGNMSSSVSDMLNMVSMNSKNIEQMSAGMRQPVNFEATEFGSKLFDDFQVGSKLTTSTMLADLDKTRSLNQSNFDEQFTQTRSLFGQQLDNNSKLVNVQLDGLSKQDMARMESLQVERLARKSMTDEQFADWKRKSTEKASAAKSKTTDKKKDEPNFLERMGLNTGTAVGAAIGTALLPGLGTVLGAGMGTLIDNVTAKDDQSKGILGGLVDSAKNFFIKDTKPKDGDLTNSVSDMLNVANINSKNIDQMSAGMKQPVNFEATEFGSKLFDDFQVGSKLTTSTMLADLEKTRNLNQSNFDEQFNQSRSLFGQQFENNSKLVNVQLAGLSMQDQARMQSLEVERIARKNLTDDQFADWKRKSAEKANVTKGKLPDKKKDEPNFLERMGLNTGTAVGAAIGTVLLPGLGTVLGAGMGTLVDNVTAKDDQSKGVLGGLVDSAKNFFTGGNNRPVTGKQSETYTINGKPASKEQFDKYMKDNPELAQLMGKAQGINKDNNTKDPVSGAMDSIKNAFSDKGIIGDFANKNKEMLAGAGAGLMVGGPMGAVVGGLAGQVAAMTDAMKPKTTKEEVKQDEVTRTVKQDKPQAEASPEMKTLTDNMTQLVLISQQQIQQQREMIDTLGRHKDIAERHYQSSL